MVADHEQGAERSRSEHYDEWTRLVIDGEAPGRPGGAAFEEWVAKRARELERDAYSIHMHVWTQAEFLALILHCRERFEDAFDIEAAARQGIEFIVVLRKERPPSVPPAARRPPAAPAAGDDSRAGSRRGCERILGPWPTPGLEEGADAGPAARHPAATWDDRRPCRGRRLTCPVVGGGGRPVGAGGPDRSGGRRSARDAGCPSASTSSWSGAGPSDAPRAARRPPAARARPILLVDPLAPGIARGRHDPVSLLDRYRAAGLRAVDPGRGAAGGSRPVGTGDRRRRDADRDASAGAGRPGAARR